MTWIRDLNDRARYQSLFSKRCKIVNSFLYRFLGIGQSRIDHIDDLIDKIEEKEKIKRTKEIMEILRRDSDY